MERKYLEIIDKKSPVSALYPKMPRMSRAAQFAPYAALSGYDGVVKEEARLTERRIELDEYEIEEINDKLRLLSEDNFESRVLITYFVADAIKSGGSYITLSEKIKKIDDIEKILVTVSGKSIPLKDILTVEEDTDE